MDASLMSEKNVTVTIDGVPVTVPAGTLLVDAAKQIETVIPVYCYHPKLGPAGLCRICLVEIDKMPKLQIACNTPVTDGMVVSTQSERVNEGRRAVLELFLVNHPLDCPICDKGGECDLQDYVMAYGQGASRSADAKMPKPKAVDLGPTIVLDEERCIVCQRCVRFDDIITRERNLVVIDRGVHDIIATATDQPYESDFSGNVTELCPVGALTSKTYRFKSRPWDLNRTQTSCLQCSAGCAINVDKRSDMVVRTMSVPGDDARSDGWLCDRGRYNIGFYRDAARVTTPLYKRNGAWVQLDWDDAISLWAQALERAKLSDPATIAALGGGRLLNEEIFLIADVFRRYGVTSLDWRTGLQHQATAGKYAGTFAQLEEAQAILVIGLPPSQSAPVFDLRIRKAVHQRGAALFTFGPFHANSHVPEQRLSSLGEFSAALSPTVQRIALVWDGRDVRIGRELALLADELSASGRSVVTYIAGEQNNALGAEALGLHPAFAPGYSPVERGRSTHAILEAASTGGISVLSLFGVNPIVHYGDRRLIETALARVPFVVVSELFMTETAEFATLVLPARGGFEKDGHSFALDGSVARVTAAVAPPAGTLSDGEMVIALADALHVPVPRLHELSARGSAPLPSASRTIVFGDPRIGERAGSRPATRPTTNSLELHISASIFSGAGTVAADDTLGELRPRASITLALETAQSFSLAHGDIVDVVTIGEDGRLHDLIVVIDDGATPGIGLILSGIASHAPNRLAGNFVEIVNIRKAARDLAASGARS
jgi:NADH-quinone oxidoreductase subunit G